MKKQKTSIQENEKIIVQPNQISRASYVFDTITKKRTSHLSSLKKIFCDIIYNIKINQGKDDTLKFKPSKLVKELKFSRVDRLIPILDDLSDLKLKLKIEQENEIVEYKIYNFLDSCSYSKEKDEIEITIARGMKKILEQHIDKNFTRYQLKEMISLSNFYSMRIYELLMSWKGIKGKYNKPETEWYKQNIQDQKNSWFIDYEITEMKDILSVKGTGNERTNNFLERCIRKPIDLLNKELPNYEFKLQEIRKFDKIFKNNENRGEIERIIIWITEKFPETEENIPEKIEYTITHKLETKEMKECIEDQNKLERMKKIYPEEFQKRFEQKTKNRKIYEKDFLIETTIFFEMLEEGFTI